MSLALTACHAKAEPDIVKKLPGFDGLSKLPIRGGFVVRYTMGRFGVYKNSLPNHVAAAKDMADWLTSLGFRTGRRDEPDSSVVMYQCFPAKQRICATNRQAQTLAIRLRALGVEVTVTPR